MSSRIGAVVEGAAGAVAPPPAPVGVSSEDAVRYLVHQIPVPADLCGNGRDDNNNGEIDDGCGCEVGSTQSCFLGAATLAGVGACKLGIQRCLGDESSEFRSWSVCQGEGAPSAEACDDMIDNDCDGAVDEDCGCTEGDTVECEDQCGVGVSVCRNRVYTECSVRQPSAELCNGIDDDCDGTIDDIADQACSSACGSGTRSCEDGEWTSCSAPSPVAETCNDRDDDCDGFVDNGLSTNITFVNDCGESPVFLVIGGCNTCSGSCDGYWVNPGESHTLRVALYSCFGVSAFADTDDGRRCLVNNGAGDYIGEVRELCSRGCEPVRISMGDPDLGC